MPEFQFPEERYIIVDGKFYITVNDAINVVRQRFPHYTDTNLYNATRILGADGKPMIESIQYRPPIGGHLRRLLEVDSLRKFLSRPALGSQSR